MIVQKWKWVSNFLMFAKMLAVLFRDDESDRHQLTTPT